MTTYTPHPTLPSRGCGCKACVNARTTEPTVNDPKYHFDAYHTFCKCSTCKEAAYEAAFAKEPNTTEEGIMDPEESLIVSVRIPTDLCPREKGRYYEIIARFPVYRKWWQVWKKPYAELPLPIVALNTDVVYELNTDFIEFKKHEPMTFFSLEPNDPDRKDS